MFTIFTGKLHKKGQSVMEYALILGIVGVSLALMQTYLRRGIQAGYKISADQLGVQAIVEEEEIPTIGAKYTLAAAYKVYGGRQYGAAEGGLRGYLLDQTILRSPAEEGKPVSTSLSNWSERKQLPRQ